MSTTLKVVEAIHNDRCVACDAKIDDDTRFKKYFCSLTCWLLETDYVE